MEVRFGNYRNASTKHNAPTGFTPVAGGFENYIERPSASGRTSVSRNHIRNNFAVHIGQAVIAALESVRQLFVIEAHEMGNRRL